MLDNVNRSSEHERFKDSSYYNKLKLKSGIEIHQQLDVGGKLFSRSAGFLQNDEPEFKIMRKLHRVAGEGGEIDEAVEHEAKLDKEFFYQGNSETAGLIELDEEPPKEINEDALDEVLKIALLLNCEIYQTTQVMRKTVIDGSNTGGFQRTVLVGHDGFLEMSFGKVEIESVVLEEDSCRIISRGKGQTVYNLDRLGIPLIEIATGADMKTPRQIKEVALKIGDILRACKIKRGIGTIRQDVNVSTKGHDRVEIKGFQDPKMMMQTVDLEIERQQKEVKEGEGESHVRKAKDDGSTEFMRPMPGKARMYPETDLPLLRISRQRIDGLKKRLPKLRGEIRDELKNKGVSGDLLELVLKDFEEFEILMRVYGKDANLIAKMVSLWRKDIASRLDKSLIEIKEKVSERVLEEILEALEEGKIGKGDIKEIMFKVGSGDGLEEALKVEKVDDDLLEGKIREVIKANPGLRDKAYMGLIMKDFKGKINSEDEESSESTTPKRNRKKVVDARKAMEIIQRILSTI
jgi:Glu-tRNA(Gln) amidotransferase subunit E-like FAD-binding protein